MMDVKKVADEADLIIAGYAFSKCDMGYRVINLHHPEKAVVLSEAGEPLEMSMDDIELKIVIDIYNKDKEFLEV